MCSIFTNKSMDPLTDSDNKNPAMLASRNFDKIIEQIQSSNLNFQLQISPFSAQISLKKSIVKEKSGALRLPPPPAFLPSHESDLAALAAKNLKLERDLDSLRSDYVRAVDDCQETHLKLKSLENVKNYAIKQEADEKLLVLVDNLKHDMSNLVIENKGFRFKVEEQKEDIQDLENSLKIKIQVSERLNKELNDIKIKAEKEKASNKRMHKADVKSWKQGH